MTDASFTTPGPDATPEERRSAMAGLFLCPSCPEQLTIPVGAHTVKCSSTGAVHPWVAVTVYTVRTYAERARLAAAVVEDSLAAPVVTFSVEDEDES